MSILTADYSEIIAERKRNAEAIAKDRPVAPSKKSRWRDIENKMFVLEMKALKRANMAIG